LPPTWTPHPNVIADYWQDGQIALPPVGAPTATGYVQTLKPKIAYNEHQVTNLGWLFFLVNVTDSWYPNDATTDPNGIGSLLALPSVPDFYLLVVAVWPVYSEGSIVAWTCLCKRVYP